MNQTLKAALLVGAVIVIPGMGLFLLAKAAWKEIDEREKFRQYVKKTYGKESSYVERT